jgi:hypothetical protein
MTKASAKTSFYIDVPLHTTMRIIVERPEGFPKDEVVDSITRDELSRCQLLTGWDCVKFSWAGFLASKKKAIDFNEGTPPKDMLLEAFGF